MEVLPRLLLQYLRVVRGIRRLRTAAGRKFTTAALLRGTASIIYDSFNFFPDGGNEVGKEFTLGRRSIDQLVNRNLEVSSCWPWKLK